MYLPWMWQIRSESSPLISLETQWVSEKMCLSEDQETDSEFVGYSFRVFVKDNFVWLKLNYRPGLWI
jgi:hypothetical protein